MQRWEGSVVKVDAIDQDRVLMTTATRAASKEGVGLEQDSWFVVTVRDGKLARTESYRSREKALEAAGLKE